MLTGLAAKILLCFSVYTNGGKILSTEQPPGAITCLHGIRFLSMTWVILGHTGAFSVLLLGKLCCYVACRAKNHKLYLKIIGAKKNMAM